MSERYPIHRTKPLSTPGTRRPELYRPQHNTTHQEGEIQNPACIHPGNVRVNGGLPPLPPRDRDAVTFGRTRV